MLFKCANDLRGWGCIMIARNRFGTVTPDGTRGIGSAEESATTAAKYVPKTKDMCARCHIRYDYVLWAPLERQIPSSDTKDHLVRVEGRRDAEVPRNS